MKAKVQSDNNLFRIYGRLDARVDSHRKNFVFSRYSLPGSKQLMQNKNALDYNWLHSHQHRVLMMIG